MVVEENIPYERRTADPADKVEYLYKHQTGTKFAMPEKLLHFPSCHDHVLTDCH
jgi:hypothetical protein